MAKISYKRVAADPNLPKLVGRIPLPEQSLEEKTAWGKLWVSRKRVEPVSVASGVQFGRASGDSS